MQQWRSVYPKADHTSELALNYVLELPRVNHTTEKVLAS